MNGTAALKISIVSIASLKFPPPRRSWWSSTAVSGVDPITLRFSRILRRADSRRSPFSSRSLSYCARASSSMSTLLYTSFARGIAFSV